MLSILEVHPERERGFFSRHWHGLFPSPVDGYLRTIGQTPYIRIVSEIGKKGLDWRMIAAYCLDASGRLLLPKGIRCPDEINLRGFRPTEFRRKLMENLALDVLVSMETPPCERRVAVYSREAEVIELLPRLAPLTGELRIITRRPYALREVVDELVRNTGMPVTMTDQPDAYGYHILLAPDGGAGLIGVDGECTVFSPVHPMRGDALWISAARASLPPVLEELFSPEYEINEFAGAFYEIGGMRELGRMSPAVGFCCCQEVSAKEIAMATDNVIA